MKASALPPVPNSSVFRFAAVLKCLGQFGRGDDAMPEYRLYHFKRDHIQRAETMTAVDDLAAVADAETRIDGQTAELWRGGRRLKTFNAPRD